jgi:hypothetical protein
MIGYLKGKETEVSQHQLPPPYEASELYGSIILISHSSKSSWDTSTSAIDTFSPSDYEVFYEKACSGELEEAEEEEKEEDEEIVEEEEDVVEEDVEEEECDELIAVDDEDEVVEEAPRARVSSRKVPKIDPQQLQFQYKSVLVPQTAVDPSSASVRQRENTINFLKTIVGDQCSDANIQELEMGIFNASLEEATRRKVPLTWDHDTFRWIYNMISKRTAGNFQPSSYIGNTSLIERWKEGEFSLETLGHWTPYELKPAHWKDLKDQQFRREKRILEGNLAMATDRFRCSRCKKKLCSYYELQTRSADEPMTIFISCLNCGKQWKQ